MRSVASISSLRVVGTGAIALFAWGVFCAPLAGGEVANVGTGAGDRASIRRGEEFFLREWMPDDPRSYVGDGLGPVFNDTSCVACHNLGSPGGGGPASKNVPILSAIELGEKSTGLFGGAITRTLRKKSVQEPAKAEPKRPADIEALAAVHAGFRTSRSVVLHRYGTDPWYQDWRSRLFEAVQDNRDAPPSPPQQPRPLERETGEDRAVREILRARATGAMSNPFMPVTVRRGDFLLVLTGRNTPPLFGVGQIDAISDAVLEQAASQKDPEAPEIHGRVSRLPGGKIGRFGWKGQTPDLKEFVLTACAVELGLEVTGHSQGTPPSAPHYRARGLDLDQAGTEALVAYVRSLPAPAVREGSSRREANAIKAGRDAFERVGCARCHVPDLGEVKGLYSDLLLHDMGDELSDTGAYGVFVASADGKEPGRGASTDKDHPAASAKEWRTPPLWGFRDSGPYLHDGRAEDLEQAVAAHGGEAARSAQKFFMLTPRERLKVDAFLKTSTAPNGVAPKGG